MKKTAGRIFLTLIAISIAGCATPEPKKLDISKIPVQRTNIPVAEGSLWPGENSRNALFQDLRARNIGDIITIVVSEKTSAIKQASTSTARDSNADIGVSELFGLPLNMGARNFLNQGNPFNPEVRSAYSTDFNGTGSTKRSGELSAVITARVVEMLPNGNLVIEGKKDTIVNNELQYIVLSGIVRPEDITDSNTIASSLISDARIEYSGMGVLADEQRPGWLRRFLDNTWPF